jgi:peptide/nickel transport system substrate-binding protein
MDINNQFFHMIIKKVIFSACYILIICLVHFNVYGQTLLIAVQDGSILNLDPHVPSNGYGAQIVKDNVYESLFLWPPKPVLAESWKWPDERNVILKLRQNVKFHNGDDFTADDLIYSFDRQSQQKFLSSAAFERIVEIKKLDQYTVQVTSRDNESAILIPLLSLYIVDRNWIDKINAPDVHTNANGTGPFKLVNRRHGDPIILARNEKWWGDNHQSNLERVEIIMMPNEDSLFQALLTGRVDISAPISSPDLMNRISRNPNLAFFKSKFGIVAKKADIILHSNQFSLLDFTKVVKPN